jgi:nucleoid DNA-binding protein
MNKIKESDLIRQIATDTGLTIMATNQVIQSLKDVIIDNLRNNNQVNLIGFGSFEPFIRHKRNGVNLSNAFQPIVLPQIRIAKFRTGYRMKRMLKKD